MRRRGEERINDLVPNDTILLRRRARKNRRKKKAGGSYIQKCSRCGEDIRLVKTRFGWTPYGLDQHCPHTHSIRTISSAFETNRQRH